MLSFFSVNIDDAPRPVAPRVQAQLPVEYVVPSTANLIIGYAVMAAHEARE